MRFILFSGECYYARGGWHDSPVLSDDLDGLKKLAEDRVENHGHEWWHIVDLNSCQIVAQSDQQPYSGY